MGSMPNRRDTTMDLARDFSMRWFLEFDPHADDEELEQLERQIFESRAAIDRRGANIVPIGMIETQTTEPKVAEPVKTVNNENTRVHVHPEVLVDESDDSEESDGQEQSSDDISVIPLGELPILLSVDEEEDSDSYYSALEGLNGEVVEEDISAEGEEMEVDSD